MIMPGAPVRYTLEIVLVEAADEVVDRPSTMPVRQASTPVKAEPVWYRGDLHTHSHHSDAARDFTLSDMARLAKDFDLDFFFLTDHNTNAGLVSGDAPLDGGPLVGRGIELTTFWGHALCLGTDRWIDWRVRPGTGAMARIAETARRDGQIFVIAHPMAEGDPGCTGCAWRFGAMMPGNARYVEVWNGPWTGDSNNEAALALWYDWLNQGRRMVATAGTDVHGAIPAGVTPGFSVIHAEALSEAALLDGLRAGHLYLSAGPALRLEAEDGEGRRAMMGDTVTESATFRVAWEAVPAGGEVRLLVNGRLLRAVPAESEGAYRWAMGPAEADWVVAEARGEDGALLAVTNPIFLDIED
jgi:hypothetical protein